MKEVNMDGFKSDVLESAIPVVVVIWGALNPAAFLVLRHQAGFLENLQMGREGTACDVQNFQQFAGTQGAFSEHHHDSKSVFIAKGFELNDKIVHGSHSTL